MKKFKLFTHTDLDGVGCAVLGKLVFGDNVDITYCDYINVNEEIKKYIESKEFLKYNFCYITDISINEEIEDLINNTCPEEYTEGFMLNDHFQLLDHHPTSEFLNRNFWCKVEVENSIEKTSGTELFYENLLLSEEIDTTDNISDFVITVKRYDTWLWATKYHDNFPKQLNDLFFIYGRDRFINTMIRRLLDKLTPFNLTMNELILLDIQQEKIDVYVNSKSKNIIIKELQGYKAGIVFSEQYISELGNRLSEMNPNLDLIAIISEDKVSYRTVKDGIDLGKFAQLYGGGGHPKSAGSEIKQEIKNKYIEMIFGE